jgi:hypothetical protein
MRPLAPGRASLEDAAAAARGGGAAAARRRRVDTRSGAAGGAANAPPARDGACGAGAAAARPAGARCGAAGGAAARAARSAEDSIAKGEQLCGVTWQFLAGIGSPGVCSAGRREDALAAGVVLDATRARCKTQRS